MNNCKKNMDRITDRVHHLHQVLAPNVPIGVFASQILRPEALGYEDRSRFYEPVSFGVHITGRANNPRGALRISVPVNGNERNWLPIMKSRFARMINMPDMAKKQIDFRTVDGRALESFSTEQLPHVGRLHVYIDNVKLNMPSMPAVPVEYSTKKAEYLKKWIANVAEKLPEFIGEHFAGLDGLGIDNATRPNGSFEKAVRTLLIQSAPDKDWTEFVRIHNMNSPDGLTKDAAVSVATNIAADVRGQMHGLMKSAQKAIKMHLDNMEAKRDLAGRDSTSHETLFSKTAPVAGEVVEHGTDLFCRLGDDLIASPYFQHSIIDNLYSRPLPIAGCRWDQEPERLDIPKGGGGGGGGGSGIYGGGGGGGGSPYIPKDAYADILIKAIGTIQDFTKWPDVNKAITDILSDPYYSSYIVKILPALVAKNVSPESIEIRMLAINGKDSLTDMIVQTYVAAKYLQADLSKEFVVYQNQGTLAAVWSSIKNRFTNPLYVTFNDKLKEATVKFSKRSFKDRLDMLAYWNQFDREVRKRIEARKEELARLKAEEDAEQKRVDEILAAAGVGYTDAEKEKAQNTLKTTKKKLQELDSKGKEEWSAPMEPIFIDDAKNKADDEDQIAIDSIKNYDDSDSSILTLDEAAIIAQYVTKDSFDYNEVSKDMLLEMIRVLNTDDSNDIKMKPKANHNRPTLIRMIRKYITVENPDRVVQEDEPQDVIDVDSTEDEVLSKIISNSPHKEVYAVLKQRTKKLGPNSMKALRDRWNLKGRGNKSYLNYAKTLNWRDFEALKLDSRISAEHHPFNALIHATLEPALGNYPSYYKSAHTKTDMSAQASYAGDVASTYKAYHAFMGVPLTTQPGVFIACHGNMQDKKKEKKKSGYPNYRYDRDNAPLADDAATLEMPKLVPVRSRSPPRGINAKPTLISMRSRSRSRRRREEKKKEKKDMEPVMSELPKLIPIQSRRRDDLPDVDDLFVSSSTLPDVDDIF